MRKGVFANSPAARYKMLMLRFVAKTWNRKVATHGGTTRSCAR
jgi:hypothetical protein